MGSRLRNALATEGEDQGARRKAEGGRRKGEGLRGNEPSWSYVMRHRNM